MQEINILVVDYPVQQTVELSIICNECHLSAYLQGTLFRLIRGGATAAAAAAAAVVIVIVVGVVTRSPEQGRCGGRCRYKGPDGVALLGAGLAILHTVQHV